MAAIFYEAVSGNVSVKTTKTLTSNPGIVFLNISGENKGFAKGDKIKYVNGAKTFEGAISLVVLGQGTSQIAPAGTYTLMVPVTNSTNFSGLTGGTVSAVTTATVVKPAATSVAAPVVSAATQLKAGATAAPPAEAVKVAEPGLFGLSKKAWMAAGVIGIAAAILVFKKGKKK